MKLKKFEVILLGIIYCIICINILFSGIMLDWIALLMGIALYPFSVKIKELGNIFFVSAIIFYIFAIILYLINSEYLPYNSSANWAYFFFFFGIIKMIFEVFHDYKR